MCVSVSTMNIRGDVCKRNGQTHTNQVRKNNASVNFAPVNTCTGNEKHHIRYSIQKGRKHKVVLLYRLDLPRSIAWLEYVFIWSKKSSPFCSTFSWYLLNMLLLFSFPSNTKSIQIFSMVFCKKKNSLTYFKLLSYFNIHRLWSQTKLCETIWISEANNSNA